MPVIALDTAGPVVGVSLWDGTTAHTRTHRITRGAEGLLMPWVVELLGVAGLDRAELVGVAVVHGPGAFTGLRVGLAAAAGLAMSLQVPLWSTGSLRPRAARVPVGEGPLLTMMDARKKRVYAAWTAEDGRALSEPVDIAPAALLADAPSRFRATGEGALVYRELVEQAGGRVVDVADDPGVDVLARHGAEALARGEGRPPGDVQPVYLRAPDAKPSGKGRIL